MAGESLVIQQGFKRINGVRDDLCDESSLTLLVPLPRENSYGTDHHAESKS
jgi:hypothetical protein